MKEHEMSDEATGLPPLEIAEPEDTMIVVAWATGEGIVDGPHTTEPQAVRFLHVRGLATADDGAVEWVQVHLAVPVEHAIDVAVALGKAGSGL